jgi:hypothetical protein
MACPFCATGQGGLQRNLSTGEIVEQVRQAAAAARDGALGEPTRLSNVVFMGMGRAARQLQPGGGRRPPDHRAQPGRAGDLRARRHRVHRSGLVPAIDKLAAEGPPVTLAVSLHTPDDELRDTLVPVNTRWKVAEVLAAARRYATATGRRVSIEYALIRDVNDQPWRADLLGTVLRQQIGAKRVHVNLIRSTPHRAASGTPRPASGRTSSCDGWKRRASPAPCATPAARRSPPPAASSPLPESEHLGQVERDRLLQLLVRAGGRLAVGPPPHELGGVPEADALHVVVAHLDHPLGPERDEREVLVGVPPAPLALARRAVALS